MAVKKAGKVRLKVTARSGKLADAMQKEFIAYPHGITKMIALAGKVRGSKETVNFDLPPRKQGSTRMSVQVTPSQAVGRWPWHSS